MELESIIPPTELDICWWAARSVVRSALETTVLVEWALACRSLTSTYKEVRYPIFDIASVVSMTVFSHLRLFT